MSRPHPRPPRRSPVVDMKDARPVLARVKDNEFVEAGPHDFRLGLPGPPPRGAWWSPYAMEPDCERLWWVATPRPLHERSEPFLYLAQYRAATHLAEGSASDLPPAVAAPRRFVFSVGRCGSTLLSALAAEGGLTSVSEPDALTPLALDQPPHSQAARVYAPVLDACLEGWREGAAAGPTLVKLRAQHSNAAHLALIARAVAVPSFTFVFREPRAWARSMAGHFGLSAERLAALYAAPVAAHREATRLGLERSVLTYETMRADADAALAALGLSPGTARVPEASSQSGTRLADAPPSTPEAARTVDAFMERWPDIRAGAALALDW